MLPIHSGNFASAVHGMHSFASEDTSPASSQVGCPILAQTSGILYLSCHLNCYRNDLH